MKFCAFIGRILEYLHTKFETNRLRETREAGRLRAFFTMMLRKMTLKALCQANLDESARLYHVCARKRPGVTLFIFLG